MHEKGDKILAWLEPLILGVIPFSFQSDVTLKTVFVDTFFEPTSTFESQQFLKYSTQLWNFTSNAKPFECKDIKTALTELMEADKSIKVSYRVQLLINLEIQVLV